MVVDDRIQRATTPRFPRRSDARRGPPAVRGKFYFCAVCLTGKLTEVLNGLLFGSAHLFAAGESRRTHPGIKPRSCVHTRRAHFAASRAGELPIREVNNLVRTVVEVVINVCRHCGSRIRGLTPELSRAAKRRRLG